MEIADVIAHKMHFRLLLSLFSHQHHRPRRTSRSSKKVNLGGDGKLVSSPPMFSGVISWGDVTSLSSKRSHCPFTRIKCGDEKVELGCSTNARHFFLNSFSTPKLDSPLTAKMLKLPSRVP